MYISAILPIANDKIICYNIARRKEGTDQWDKRSELKLFSWVKGEKTYGPDENKKEEGTDLWKSRHGQL